MNISWDFINAWTKSENQDFTEDHRGWITGKSRKHPDDIKDRVIRIRAFLEESKDEYYSGDLAIQQHYAKAYPNDPLPGLDYINDIIRWAGLAKRRYKRRKGVSRYLCYPELCIQNTGNKIADVDFIGHKFVQGFARPLHFLSIAYRNPRRLRCIKRTNAETALEAITMTNRTFDELGWPDAVKCDGGAHFAGKIPQNDGKGMRSLSQYAINLLRHEVIPVYGNPRSPWNQGTVEGSNSVFGRNFWNKHEFTSIKMVDDCLAIFNRKSREYSDWVDKWIKEPLGQLFIPRVCFIRKVGEDERNKYGTIPIASETINLPKEYIGYFVFAEWNLREQRLKIFFEREGEIQQIEEKVFLINPRTRSKCTDLFT